MGGIKIGTNDDIRNSNDGPATLHKQEGLKARGTYDPHTPLLESGSNISSVLDVATGRATLNFTNAFADTIYTFTGSAGGNGGNSRIVGPDASTTNTTSAYSVESRHDNGSLSDGGKYLYVLFAGDLA